MAGSYSTSCSFPRPLWWSEHSVRGRHATCTAAPRNFTLCIGPWNATYVAVRNNRPPLLASVLVALALSACSPRGMSALQALATTAEVAVAVVQLAEAINTLSSHDAHYHGGYCHKSRYYDGRYNYWYQGRWEFYDKRSESWYAY